MRPKQPIVYAKPTRQAYKWLAAARKAFRAHNFQKMSDVMEQVDIQAARNPAIAMHALALASRLSKKEKHIRRAIAVANTAAVTLSMNELASRSARGWARVVDRIPKYEEDMAFDAYCLAMGSTPVGSPLYIESSERAKSVINAGTQHPDRVAYARRLMRKLPEF